MASSRIPARRRILLTAVAACGVALVPSPGVAAPSDPSTSAEAAQLVAARAHPPGGPAPPAPPPSPGAAQLVAARPHAPEVVPEQVNEPREQLTQRQAAAAQAAQQVQVAEPAVLGARQNVRSVARSAY